MGTALQKQTRGEGYVHYGYHRTPLSSSASSAMVTSAPELMAQWQAWLRKAEALFVIGRFKACNEALHIDCPPHPAGPMAAALLAAIARTNAAICRHTEISMAMGGGGRHVGGGDSRSDLAAENAHAEAREASIAALENALQDIVNIGTKAVSSPPTPPLQAATPDARAKNAVAGRGATDGTEFAAGSMPPSVNSRKIGQRGGSGARVVGTKGGERGLGGGGGGGVDSGLCSVVIAAASEDVAVQAACALLMARLAWGEPLKALSTGLQLLVSRRNTIAAASAATGTASIGGGSDDDRGESSRLAEQGNRVCRDAEGVSPMGEDEGQGGGAEDILKREEREEECARDAFAGVDALRDMFESALDGTPGARGRRSPLAEAAPRLLHLLRLSWLLAAANLALDRPAAAARILAVAEHAYGARRSAWRKASLILANSPRGASSAIPAPLGPSASLGCSATSAAVSAGEYLVGGGGRGGWGAAGARDPALAMCRFLRGLGLLAGGDATAAAVEMKESLDLDPRARNPAVCLAHLSCFASANATNVASRASKRLQWNNPVDDRTREVLRLLALGVSFGKDGVLEEGRFGRVGEEGRREFDGNRGAFGGEGSGGGGVEARLLLACVARAKGDVLEANSMFRKALAIDPNCLEAVYGIARVCQESEAHDTARGLLLFLGEQSQERVASVTTSAAASVTDENYDGDRRSVDNSSGNKASAEDYRGGGSSAGDGDDASSVRDKNTLPGGGGNGNRGGGGNGGGGGAGAGAGAGGGSSSSSTLASSTRGAAGARRSRRDARLCFLLGGGSGRSGGGGGGGGGGVVRSPVLPAALREVMWRVARASMAVREWATASLALKELVAEGRRTPTRSPQQPVYYASSARGDTPLVSPGPGHARVLRALAYCQLQDGLHGDALETSQAVLGDRGTGTAGAGGEAEDAKAGEDAAMLMFRADALLCLEKGEAVALASLEHAAQLLNRRQIDMSAPSLPPPPERSLSPPTMSASELEVAGATGVVAPTEDVKHAAAAEYSRSKRRRTSWRGDVPPASAGVRDGADAVGPKGGEPTAFISTTKPTAAAADTADTAAAASVHASPPAGLLSSEASRDDRNRRLARVAAFNNRAVLLIAAGRGTEACRLLRSCLLIIPGEPRPAFNLALALWRLGRPRSACLHWLESRGWGGERGRDDYLDVLVRLLELARRRKVLLQSNGDNQLQDGPSTDGGRHVTDGRGDALSVPQSQLCLLDIRTLTWWLGNVGAGLEPPAASGNPAAAAAAATLASEAVLGGLRSLVKR